MATPRAFFKEGTTERLVVGVARLVRAFLLVTTLVSTVPRSAAAQAPDADWRTLTTRHFRITYTPPLEEVARRAAHRAEVAWTRLDSLFLEGPPGMVDLLLSDHTDLSNGSAVVTPDKRVTVFVAPPVDDLDLGYFDEWIELVVTHEVAHIFHLDRAGALGNFLRSIFGRIPGRWPYFPGFDTPRWAVEGLATWYESEITEAGRVEGSYQETVLRTAFLEGRFEELDQASGASPVWPGGARVYIYGARFFDYLMEKHGPESMAAFARAVAGQWIPYRLDAAGKDAFGVSISEEWSAWTDSVEAEWADVESELAAQAPLTRPDAVTRGARQALHPQVGPGGRLAFARADGRSDPQLRVVEADGGEGRELLHTNSLVTFSWLPDGDLIMGESEFVDPYRSYGDLYRVDGRDGSTRRLTRGARLSHPSPVPGADQVVAVQGGEGSSWLVTVDLADGSVRGLTAPDSPGHWTTPAVSPNGRWVAAAHWSPGALLDVVVLDRASGREVARLTRDRAMDFFPAWSPDGRWLVWTSDRTGIHNLVAREMDPESGRPVGDLRLVTNMATAAAYPSVTERGGPSDSGEDEGWIYFSGYHADGWDVERIPFRPDSWAPVPPLDPRFATAADPAPPTGSLETPGLVARAEPYSALPTLLPRYWEPLYEEPVRSRPIRSGNGSVPSRTLLHGSVGAETSGNDLVKRHAYTAFARVHLGGDGRMDGGLSWSWAGLGNPVLSAGVNQIWSSRGARLVGTGVGQPLDTLYALERRRAASLGVTFLRTRIRSRLSLSLSGGWVRETVEFLDPGLDVTDAYSVLEPEGDRMDLRATLDWSTIRSYAYQMGGSDGASLFLQGRTRLDLDRPTAFGGRPGLDGSLDDVTAQVRLFRSLEGPGFSAHVLAFRGSAGYARGPGAGAGHFSVGGAAGRQESITGLALFGGSGLFFPLRGYDRNARFGSTAWSVTGEYRFPVLLVHQGLGAWPLHLDRIAGSVFADGGNAWGPELAAPGYQNPRRDPLASVGVELTADLLTLWSEPLLLRTGVALPLVEGSGSQVYVRLGFSF